MMRKLIAVLLVLVLAPCAHAFGPMAQLATARRDSVVVRVTPVLAASERGGIVICADGGESFGENIVTNGGFDSDTDWAKGSNVTISSGTINYNDGGESVYSSQIANVESGTFFEVQCDCTAYTSGWFHVFPGFSLAGFVTDENATGSYLSRAIASGTEQDLVWVKGSNFVGSLDNVSCRQILAPSTAVLVEIDRTLNKLIVTKRIDFTETELISKTITYADDHELVVVCERQSDDTYDIWVFYDGAQEGATQTISDRLYTRHYVPGDSGSFTGFSATRISLSATIATGTLSSGQIYKIITTEADHFYAGCAVADFFISDGTETCDASNTVQKVQ